MMPEISAVTAQKEELPTHEQPAGRQEQGKTAAAAPSGTDVTEGYVVHISDAGIQLARTGTAQHVPATDASMAFTIASADGQVPLKLVFALINNAQNAEYINSMLDMMLARIKRQASLRCRCLPALRRWL